MDHLYIVRHGQTLWNVEKRMQGRLDSPLSEIGRVQARANGRVLARDGVTQLFTSPLGRTVETAELIAAQTGATIEFDDRLMERDVGEWGGYTVAEVANKFPTEWAVREADAYHHRPPRGENLPDMSVRIRPLLDRLRQMSTERVGLVTHSVMARVILTEMLGLSPAESLAVMVPNDVVYHVVVAGSGEPGQSGFVESSSIGSIASSQATPEVRYFHAGGSAIAGLLRYDAV